MRRDGQRRGAQPQRGHRVDIVHLYLYRPGGLLTSLRGRLLEDDGHDGDVAEEGGPCRGEERVVPVETGAAPSAVQPEGEEYGGKAS